MAHFAKVEDNIVVEVIVAEREFIDSGVLGDPSKWIQTSYNTFGGVNRRPGGVPLRMNYAGIGYLYDEELDAFIPPKPFDSWSLNRDNCCWESPIPKPDDGKTYIWNEEELTWDESESVLPLPSN